MYRYAVLKRAPQKGALFAFWLFVSCVVQADELCLPLRVDESAVVERVIDGDTVRLQDGRHVRLIGINAPELARDAEPAQPLAEEARQWLAELLDSKPVVLRFGKERQDHYGRVLAHLFLEDGRNVQALLLERGLAAAVSVAPNVGYVECYLVAEQRSRGIGIWRQPQFQSIDSRYVERKGGFRIVQGVVERVREDVDTVWVEYPNRVVLRVNKEDLPYFKDQLNLKDLEGKRLKARGWMAVRGDELQLRVSHPAALEVLK